MSAYNVEQKHRMKEMLESGSGSKFRQTLQMILMVIIPIIALISFTTVALISALETSTQASEAKNQMKLIFQVSWKTAGPRVVFLFCCQTMKKKFTIRGEKLPESPSPSCFR